MAFDPPIYASAVITEILSDRTFRLKLPNGKLTLGHTPKRLAELRPSLLPGCQVEVEMTPFDFEKARIVALLTNTPT